MTEPQHTLGEDAARGELLLWQSNYRMALAAAIAGSGFLLRVLGVVSAHSVAMERWGARGAGIAFAAVAAAYVLFNAVIRARLTRRTMASARLVALVVAADVIVVHVCALLLTPPPQYDRALILAMVLVQFTQFYFGWRTTLFEVSLVAVAYTSIVALARRAGMLEAPIEELWTFALFGLGTLTYAWLLGHQGMRMRRLTQLFERAREGDFQEPYDDSRDRWPDHITQIGRSYNDLRGHLETIILTDPLSGCFNRRGFKQLAAREVSRSIRAKQQVAMLALDVDHFKRINDDFGHLTGDEAIREIGALIREIARAGDVVARTGGEEFCILAPDTDEAGAMQLAGRVMQAFRSHLFTSLRGQMQVTVSLGVASDEATADDVVAILTARADEALYVAKRSGRDQAVLWQTGMRAFDAITGRASREIERMP